MTKRKPKTRFEHPETVVGAASPARPRTAATAEAVNGAALETMSIAVDVIRDQIELIQAGKGGESKHDPASRISFLGQRAGVLFEATRKALAARARELSVITPALVLAWYRQLDRTERERILSELIAADSRKSGLA